MNNQANTLENMVAIYFAGKEKSPAELRDAIAALNSTTLFNLSADELEAVARENEAKQGVKMF